MDLRETAESAGRHACAACGNVGVWNAARQALVCQSCGTTIGAAAAAAAAVEHFALLPRLRDSADNGRDWRPRPTHLRWQSCGSMVAYDAHVVGQTCAACGTPALVPTDRTGAPVAPSGILPFRISETDARTRLAEWLRSRHVRSGQIDTIRAVYVPCWVFNAAVSCRWRGEKQRQDRDGNVERIPIDGIIERTFDDYTIPASRSIPAPLLQSVGPFPIAEMSPYDTQYLAGSTVEIYTTNMWDAWDAASGRMERELQAALRDDSDCSPSELETWPVWRDQRCAHVLVPAYVIGYRHGNKQYEAIVNGWSGTTGGDGPVNVLVAVVAIALLFALAGGALYGLYWLLF